MASFLIKFLIALLILVVGFFVLVGIIGALKGMTSAEIFQAIGDASIFTKEFWTNFSLFAGGM